MTSDTINLYTDASGSIGYAAVMGSHWFQGTWPDIWRQLNITMLELWLRGPQCCVANVLHLTVIIWRSFISLTLELPKGISYVLAT